MNNKTKLLVIVAILGLCAAVLTATLARCAGQTAPTPATPPGTEPAVTGDTTAVPTTPGATPTPVPGTLATTGPPTAGSSPTPDPYACAITPSFPPSLSPEELEQERRQWVEERNQRAQTLYNNPLYIVAFMFEQPAFKQVFPEAHMYAVLTSLGDTGDVDSFATMVSRGDRDYVMPWDFNQLMVDAGYELTPDTRDALAQALIVAAMPTEMALQPVTCDPGREIDITVGPRRYAYKVKCHVTYENIGDVNALFFAFEDLFKGGAIEWGNLREDGWREFGRVFATP